ncbi:MAG: pyruvate, phosphate dikinase [Firmicutes bacterium]|nr:pyruvate, phosphate dikinase [Bacillota bacterium]
MTKYVYSFKEGSKEMKSLLGGKGANLAEMKRIGLPVPSGFTVTTEACNFYFQNNHKIDNKLQKEINEHLELLEKKEEKKLGDNKNPLLLSIRSGAVTSMPGMMDTVLNLGLNDDTVKALAKQTSNYRFAYDSYRRFVQMFGDVVLKIPKYEFDRTLDKVKDKYNAKLDTDLSYENLKEVVDLYKKIIYKYTKKEFPQNPKEQLLMAIKAVFDSWKNERAIIYRRINGIKESLATAVNVQSMVFGNTGKYSGTGVAFTRNPVTGEKKVFGEFLINAQGEDVVAGIRTPKEISELKDILPKVYDEFMKTCEKLEEHYKDMQDIEFTVEDKRLYLLQTRTAKRTAQSATKIAVDMVKEKVISKNEALLRVTPEQVNRLLHPSFDKEELNNAKKIAKGLPASPGAASGKVYFTSEKAVEVSKNGDDVILVRTETSPEDIEGMVESRGILTSRGGMTSHAAVVARGMGKCCVAGCSEIIVEEENRLFKVGDLVIKEGEYISIDGMKGNIYKGLIHTKSPELSDDFKVFMKWADDKRRLGVRTNADTPKDSKVAIEFGAEGIGLCRTEHMFFSDKRINAVREMILSDNKKDRVKALDKLFPYQKEDFYNIFKEMKHRPVTVRLLDPPLHEFLPSEEKDIKNVAKELNLDLSVLKEKIMKLKEFNPMLGHRGCRLGISYPEIYEMQVKAIFTAAIEAKKKLDIKPHPEIMIPLIGDKRELKFLRELVCKSADKIFEKEDAVITYKVGTMIEVPRAALTSDEIANHADFFSYGTNDLTQMTFGFSRDDSGEFIREYKERKILTKDPFESIDINGVGKLMKISVEAAKKKKENIKLGICGEHGGEEKSIKFCHKLGLDYVSCSPFRVPGARLAAAQVTIKE